MANAKITVVASQYLTSFSLQGETLPIKFVEETTITAGVVCQTYLFEADSTKDLAVVTVEPGAKTPLQKIQQGDKTIEGWISGAGTLTIYHAAGEQRTYQLNGKSSLPFSVEVEVGQTMQWQAAPNSILTFYEICYPPYQEGRYETLDE